MNENVENSGKESDNDSILDLDLNPDSVIRPFMFEPQHSSSSGEEEISGRYTKRIIYVLTSRKSRVVLLRQLSRDDNRKRTYQVIDSIWKVINSSQIKPLFLQ